jgi:hypothetical protein
VGVWMEGLDGLPPALWKQFQAFTPDVDMAKAAKLLLPPQAPWWWAT